MFFKKLISSYSEAKSELSKNKLSLWYSISLLILTPIAVLILLELVPLLLDDLGVLNFSAVTSNTGYKFITFFLPLLTTVPFLHSIYHTSSELIRNTLSDADSDFKSLKNSHKTLLGSLSFGCIVFLVSLFFMQLLTLTHISIATPAQKIALLVLIAQVFLFSQLTSILCATQRANPITAWLSSFRLINKNIAWGMRILLFRIAMLAAIALPLLLLAIPGKHLMLFNIVALGLTAFAFVKLMPLYFFYPVFIYETKMKKTTSSSS